MGFLWFNAHPAQIFMGDAGSLGFGAMLAVVSMITGSSSSCRSSGSSSSWRRAPSSCRSAYFKATGGRRIFRMTPIHHHFELGGWDEEKITLRFWIVSILAGLLGVTFFLASIKALP